MKMISLKEEVGTKLAEQRELLIRSSYQLSKKTLQIDEPKNKLGP